MLGPGLQQGEVSSPALLLRLKDWVSGSELWLHVSVTLESFKNENKSSQRSRVTWSAVGHSPQY